jgi:hypothetical protein
MDNILVSQHEENNASLISLIMNEFAEKLASDKKEDLNHDVKWYLHEVDHFLKRQVEFQNMGLTLLQWEERNGKLQVPSHHPILSLVDISRFHTYHDNRKAAFNGQVKHAWDSMTLFVRRIKHGDHLASGANGYYSPVRSYYWWNFAKVSITSFA